MHTGRVLEIQTLDRVLYWLSKLESADHCTSSTLDQYQESRSHTLYPNMQGTCATRSQ